MDFIDVIIVIMLGMFIIGSINDVEKKIDTTNKILLEIQKQGK